MSYRAHGSRRRHSAAGALAVAILSLMVWYGQNHSWFTGDAAQPHAVLGSSIGSAKSGSNSGPAKAVAGALGSLESNQPGQYPLVRPVDGDTIVVDMNGHNETVRFVGVDTPETHKPNTPVQCYGPSAAAFTKNIIAAQGSKVRLAADSLSSNRDRYNRLLRYVYLPDGTLLNLRLVQDGYGFYYPYFQFTKSAEFQAAEKQAMAANKGLWGNCHPIAKDKGGYESNPE